MQQVISYFFFSFLLVLRVMCPVCSPSQSEAPLYNCNNWSAWRTDRFCTPSCECLIWVCSFKSDMNRNNGSELTHVCTHKLRKQPVGLCPYTRSYLAAAVLPAESTWVKSVHGRLFCRLQYRCWTKRAAFLHLLSPVSSTLPSPAETTWPRPPSCPGGTPTLHLAPPTSLGARVTGGNESGDAPPRQGWQMVLEAPLSQRL